ncbi:hypothetical protein [Planobispora takensis]|uniref:Lipoprotein n=1 Tax=Planobispora takensis TaxID=1367882 RepID=A0A8J3T5D9_9ACTN|nr:hypothetical protein [Planobispora takensis]GII04741.1 hypothetical protein Pta02_67490 [Planobispora takensis]
MNGTSKTGGLVPAAALALALVLSGCSEADPPAAPAAPSASGPAPASPALSAGTDPAPTPTLTASASPSLSGTPAGRGLYADPVGQVTFVGGERIRVEPDDGEAVEGELTPFTVVLDVQGGICDKGEIPHKCSVAQLKKALKADVALYAEVTVKDGLVTQVEEIVRN